MPEGREDPPLPDAIISLIQTSHGSPLTTIHLNKWTPADPVLSQGVSMVLHGWQPVEDEVFRPILRRKDEFSVLWGNRLVIPESKFYRFCMRVIQEFLG